MTQLRSNQHGAGLLVVVLAVVVVGALAVVGYRVVNSNATPTSTDNTSGLSSTAAPKSINNKSDLQRADSALDETPIDRGVATDSLDTEIKTLL